MYRTEQPTDKTIREWYMKFQQSGCLCAAKRRGRPGPSAGAGLFVYWNCVDKKLLNVFCDIACSP